MRLGPTSTTLHVILEGTLPTAQEVRDRLIGWPTGPVQVADRPDGGWEARCFREEVDEMWVLRPERKPDISDLDLDTSDLSDEEREAIREASYCLTIEAEIEPSEALQRFASLVQLGHRCANGALGLFDPEGGTVHSPSWFQDAATEGVPIRIDAMYRIHAVTTEEGVWLHTHGLRRAGIPELELLGVQLGHVHPAGALLRSVAHRAIVHGMPDMGDPILYGHGLEAALVPWDFVHEHIDPVVGGPEDRDEQHPSANLALVTWQPDSDTTGHWCSAADQLEHLEGNPVFFLTDYETERMEALARLRWQGFAFLANHFSGAEGWRFLAKFGYGGDDSGTRREHLWFEVHQADPAYADATLVNEPYQDLGFGEGDRGSHALDRLTDFRVTSPVGIATPENLDRLIRRWMSHSDAESVN